MGDGPARGLQPWCCGSWCCQPTLATGQAHRHQEAFGPRSQPHTQPGPQRGSANPISICDDAEPFKMKYPCRGHFLSKKVKAGNFHETKRKRISDSLSKSVEVSLMALHTQEVCLKSLLRGTHPPSTVLPSTYEHRPCSSSLSPGWPLHAGASPGTESPHPGPGT